MSQSGTTTGNLKLRSGPGMQFEPPIAYLEPNTALEVLGEDGDWLRVRVDGKEGFVGKKYVNVSANAVPADADDTGIKKAEPNPTDSGGQHAAGQSGGFAKRSAPPPQKPGTAGKAHKGVEDE